MPRRNRITPTGDLIATEHRGTLLGNRGVLHDADGRIVRTAQHRRWLICTLNYRGKRRPIMALNRYTELFFLDEAVALAAGHRPCAKCRPQAYDAYRMAWSHAFGLDQPPSADAMDRVLTGQRGHRRPAPGERRPAATLPDGTYILFDGEPWLVYQATLWQWSAGGYQTSRTPPGAELPILTPSATFAALLGGYTPLIHPTVTGRVDPA